MLRRKKLVRTSRTPGQTQTINFFTINSLFYFVDLPGYGFAKVPENIRAGWKPMVEAYLTGRPTLRGIVQIMDARHPPTADDLTLWHWLQTHRIPAIPVLTKVDKVPRSKWDPHLKQASLILGTQPGEIILFSATTGEGREAVLERLVVWLNSFKA